MLEGKNMATQIKVTKRDGSKELFDYNKVHFVVDEAIKGLSGVSLSDLEMNMNIMMYDGIPTSEIHDLVIAAARNLISPESPNYETVAGRAIIFQLRKQVYGKYEPHPLLDVIKRNVNGGRYDKLLLERFTEEEINELNDYVDHGRDYIFKAAGIQQVVDKYLVKDRDTEQLYETPQYMYMGISMAIFMDYDKLYDKQQRLSYIKRFYDASSTHRINLPTPIACGARTPLRQYASCVLVEIGDDMDSIIHSNSVIQKYTSQRAGIGVNMGSIRSIGSKIRGGEVVHTGLVPFLRQVQSVVKSCTQNGVRGGGATTFFPFWHKEIETVLVLKNNKGTEENRARGLDYGIQFNKLFYTRAMREQNISLFSPHDVPELYEHFGSPEFDQLYEAAEKNPLISRTTVNAMALFTDYVKERAETGRMYLQNIDHSNSHSSFNVPIRQSNLCMEITIPTKPLIDYHDEQGEVALCVLSAINLGAIDANNMDAEMLELTDLIVRALDEVIDIQNYPMPAARIATKNRRTLGVGFIGYAHFLAKSGVKYCSREAATLTHELAETLQYHLIRASALLAKDKGVCGYYHETKYSQGIFPIDTYKKDVDAVHDAQLRLDWDALRELVKQHGLRNSGLSAQMPSESSSVLSNETNGIEPPRGPLSYKKSKKGILRMLVPEYNKLKKMYQYAWDEDFTNTGYINNVAVMQKFFDQSISANEYHNPEQYPDNKIPLKEIMRNIFLMYKLGLKTAYYLNTYDGKEDDADHQVAKLDAEACSDGACKI